MRRATIVAFALVASLLVVMSMPAAAAHGPTTVSINTTDTDFAAGTLTNLSVSGTGTGASVVLDSGDTTVDDVNDASLSEYTGDTGRFSTTSSSAIEGSHMAQGSTDGANYRITSTSGLPAYPARGDTFAALVRGSSDAYTGVMYGMQDNNNGYLVSVEQRDNRVRLYRIDSGGFTQLATTSVTINGGQIYDVEVDWQADDDHVVTVYEASVSGGSVNRGTQVASVSATDGTYSSETGVAWYITGSSGANGDFDYFRIPGQATPAEYLNTHPATNTVRGFADIDTATDVSVTATWRGDSDGDGTYETLLNQTSGITSTGNHTFTWSEFTGDDVEVNLTVEGAGASPEFTLAEEGVMANTHAPSADDATASPSSGTAQEDGTATLSIDVEDGDFPTAQSDSLTAEFGLNGSLVDTQTGISSNQTLTYNTGRLSDGLHTWNVTLTDQYGHTVTSADHTFEVVHHSPVLDNSSATPTGGLSTTTPTLEIAINDTDFDDPSGDPNDVVFSVDGSPVGTDTVTSNGTASVTISGGLTGGDHTWQAVATDSYGNTTTSQTFQFQTPDQLLIYNESAPSSLVDNATVELEFYVQNGSQTDVVTRNTSNGAINMTGLPVDKPFVVVAKNESYVNRRIFVQSLFETQRIFLIPDSANIVEPTFVLTDFSGSYPPDVTVLQVERFINGSWEVVEGDYFGATGKFSAHLAFNERHRLTLINTQTGATRDLGPFTPVASGERDVEVFQDDDDVEGGVDPSATIEPSLGGLAGQSNVNVSATFTAGDGEFSSYEFNGTYQYPNGTNTTLFVRNGTSTTGETFEETLNLTGLEGGTVTLNASWTTANGTTDSKLVTLVVQSEYNNPYSLMSVLGTVTTRLPVSTAAVFTTVLAVLSTVLVTSVAAARLPLGAETVGAIPVALLAFFTTIQWVGVSLLFIAAIVWVAIVAYRRGI